MDNVMKYMGLVMAVLYLTLGVIVLNGSNRLFNLPRSYALIFGITLILYGLFRGYRIYQKHFRREL
jgi:hypothetical protein